PEFPALWGWRPLGVGLPTGPGSPPCWWRGPAWWWIERPLRSGSVILAGSAFGACRFGSDRLFRFRRGCVRRLKFTGVLLFGFAIRRHFGLTGVLCAGCGGVAWCVLRQPE